ncbi:MAG: class I SAM-dependent methyltransferase [Actinomycetota bacterium]
MRRLHIFELHDHDWFPDTWRDLFTDALSFFEASMDLYAPAARLLEPVIDGEDFVIVDLCSGAGQPVVTAVAALGDDVAGRVRVVLTDKYPNVASFERLSKESGGLDVSYVETPVDALAVPDDLEGFRTLFSSLHHFDEDSARTILGDAVAKRRGIAVFEFTDRRLLPRLLVYWLPLLVRLLVKTPSIVPFRRKRILLTYLVPVIPVVLCWDGVVSCLRSYSEDELRGLVAGLGDDDYSWRVGTVGSTGPFQVTYLIGQPRTDAVDT